MRLAIVGSVCLAGNGEAAAIIEAALDEFRPDVVVSGGAPGIDTMAVEAAKRRGIRTDVKRPDVAKWDPPPPARGFKARNMEIAAACDALVRIVAHDAATYGSGWTRDRARDMGKPTREHVVRREG